MRHIIRFLLSLLIIPMLISACQKDQVIKSVVIEGPKPTSAFTYTVAPTNALSVTFKSTAINSQSQYWTFGDGTNSTDAAPVHIYATPGRYTVNLKINSQAGYSAVSSQLVTAIPAAIPAFSIASQFELGITFANTSSSLASSVWDFGDGSTPITSIGARHRYQAAGIYTVKLTVTGLLGDTVSKTQTINVQNTNLIHGGFEAGSSSYWTVYDAHNTPVFGYTGDGPAGGYDACLQFPSFSNGQGQNELIYQPVQVVAGKKYAFSAVVKLPAGGVNDYLQFYISTDHNNWVESTTDPNANFFLSLNNYHNWGNSSSSTSAVNGDLYTATLANGNYGVGVATKGIYTAPITGTVYIGLQAGVYNGQSNGDFLIDNVSFTLLN